MNRCHIRRGGSRHFSGPARGLLLVVALGACVETSAGEWCVDTVDLPGRASESTVINVRRDRAGMLWVGTRHGLMLSDGYTVTPFEHDESDPASLSENYVRVILDDAAGDLWVGTNGGGLDRLSTTDWKFEHFRHDSTDAQSVSDDIIYALLQDRTGRLWIGTPKGLTLLDPGTRRFRRFVHDPADPGSLCHDSILALFEDHAGVVWLGTVGGGLCRVDSVEHGRFTTFRHPPEESDEFSADSVFSFAEDELGTLWVGTEYGVSKLEGEPPALHTVPHEVLTGGEPEIRLVSQMVSGEDGSIWLGTWGPGVYRLDTTTSRATPVERCDKRSPGTEDRIAGMALDREGVLWIASWDHGLGRVHTREEPFELVPQRADGTGLTNADVLSVAVDPDGGVWVGTWGGGLDHRPEDGRLFRHHVEPSQRSTVRSVLPLSPTEVWFGSTLGLHRLDPSTGRIEDYLNDPADPRSLGSGFVDALLRGRDGTLWVGTGGGGLCRLDEDGRSFDRFVHRADDPTSLGNDYVTALLEDRRGRLWVGTRSAGVNLLDRSTMRFERHPPHAGDESSISHRHVTVLLEDSAGRVWVGTAGGGFNLVTEDEGRIGFRRFSSGDGLLNDDVMGMLEDRDGSLWISTADGLARFRQDTDTWVNYIDSDGLPDAGFNFGAAAAGPERLYFGTSEGLVSVPHATPLTRSPPSPVVLTSVRELNGRGASRRAVRQLERLEVPYGEVLSFEFAVLDFDPRHRHRYAYRLEGIHDDWIDAGARREVTFANLAPGDYTLYLKGRDARGVWSTPVRPLELGIVPPFWMTHWFRALVVMAIVASAFGGHLVRTRRLERRNRELHELHAQREHALEEARASRDELQRALRNLRRLTARLEAVSEDERRHLARELHDELGQALTAAKINVRLLRQDDAPIDDRNSRLDDLVTLVDDMIRRVRELSIGLRPPLLDELGLAVGLRTFVESQGRRAGLATHVTVDRNLGRMPPEIEITAFRVVQEAMTNVIRHAGATRFRVEARRRGSAVEIVAEDDGRGFDVGANQRRSDEGGHVGLLGMRERVETVGGSLEIRSAPGEGTRVKVAIPLTAGDGSCDDAGTSVQ